MLLLLAQGMTIQSADGKSTPTKPRAARNGVPAFLHRRPGSEECDRAEISEALALFSGGLGLSVPTRGPLLGGRESGYFDCLLLPHQWKNTLSVYRIHFAAKSTTPTITPMTTSTTTLAAVSTSNRTNATSNDNVDDNANISHVGGGC
jgi:hypothetical protein